MMQSQKLSVIGTRPIRHDGVDKVIGRAQFASDMPFSDALECKILRSPFAKLTLIFVIRKRRNLSSSSSSLRSENGAIFSITINARAKPTTPNSE